MKAFKITKVATRTFDNIQYKNIIVHIFYLTASKK